MTRHRSLEHALMGAAAGLVGTFVMQAMLGAQKKFAPQTLPPMKDDPGQFMIHQAERMLPESVKRTLPDAVESAAAHSLQLGYGAAFGALYGLTRGTKPFSFWEGSLIGLATWAVGYLGWLPATGLMPPIWRHEPSRAIVPAIEHALFGVATVAAYDAIHRLAHDAPMERLGDALTFARAR